MARVNGPYRLFHPKMLVLVLWTILVAFLVWGSLAFWFWYDTVDSANQFFASSTVRGFLLRFHIQGFAATRSALLAWLLITPPCVLITALMVASVRAMPLMVRHVAASGFPVLEIKRGGTVLGEPVERAGGGWAVYAAMGGDVAALAFRFPGTRSSGPARREIKPALVSL